MASRDSAELPVGLLTGIIASAAMAVSSHDIASDALEVVCGLATAAAQRGARASAAWQRTRPVTARVHDELVGG